ncbi:hypothetical protein KL921_004474 [Ogataea angusta]|uniref:Jacalin-type lectin domain-containing protein n=1 Tax=Pichia angusta TaxID=870730 RepID=A0ABQ7RUD1_PICAN|nr:hypothetical protein KL921_004474 [Ogataea angusta]KAG7822457.1 hypothetical protein KL909_004145 [Ogataea angusta]KAG7827403.1 hypothetical protein KL920_004657 [Ogataea angusta]KAG7832724.1 hypothetical protein KL943_004665 [Ogataea angusta]KAG7837543.1 hypothetical protein KL942_004431 [Ogataea angusta]
MLGLIAVGIVLVDKTTKKIDETRAQKRKNRLVRYSDSMNVSPPPYLKLSKFVGSREFGTLIQTSVPRSIRYIEVNCNRHVENIKFVTYSGDTYMFGFWKPIKDTYRVELERGDKITKIYMKFGQYLDKIKFETKLGGQTKSMGKCLGGKYLEIPIDEDRQLAAIKGMYCQHINGIQFVTSM